MSKLVMRCWDHGHTVELNIPPSKVSKFIEQCSKLKKVCPDCSPENKQLTTVYNEADKIFDQKSYQCRHGHLTMVGTFGRSARRLGVSWGPSYDDRENVEGSIDELPELIDQKVISCQHTKENGKRCGCKLKACDDASLSYAEFSNFKTKVRVEDVWRKYGVADPVTGDANAPGEYKATEFEKRNKARLKKMQRTRNISKDRLPGKPKE